MIQRLKDLFICNLLICNFLIATRYAGDFEAIGASAKAFGLGGAFVACVSDASAIYYNPAASALLHNPQLVLLHSENYAGILKNDFLAYVRPQNSQTYGLGILSNRIPNIKIAKLLYPNLPPSDTNQPVLDKIVQASDWIFYFNYARTLNSSFNLGGNFKIIYRSLGIGSAFGFGIDVATTMLINPDFKIGVKIANLTTSPLFWSTKTREVISPKLVFGIAKSFTFKKSTVLLTTDLENNFDNFNMNTNLGFEYLYQNTFGLRFGLYHWNPTFGVGLSFKRFFIDYAYVGRYYEEDLGSSQKFSGGIKF
jgi:hypothetical protein